MSLNDIFGKCWPGLCYRCRIFNQNFLLHMHISPFGMSVFPIPSSGIAYQIDSSQAFTLIHIQIINRKKFYDALSTFRAFILKKTISPFSATRRRQVRYIGTKWIQDHLLYDRLEKLIILVDGTILCITHQVLYDA